MEKQSEDLKLIREMMERSSRFLSLSGMSGIIAGLLAIAGGLLAYYIAYAGNNPLGFDPFQIRLTLFGIAGGVLLLSLAAGIFLSVRNASGFHKAIKDPAVRNLLRAVTGPLLAGGLFCFVLFFQGYITIVISATLIFYGLALISGSRYTFGMVKYLGSTEVVLGLAAALYPQWGLWFWIAGFGVCHVVYGAVMHFKYQKK